MNQDGRQPVSGFLFLLPPSSFILFAGGECAGADLLARGADGAALRRTLRPAGGVPRRAAGGGSDGVAGDARAVAPRDARRNRPPRPARVRPADLRAAGPLPVLP